MAITVKTGVPDKADSLTRIFDGTLINEGRLSLASVMVMSTSTVDDLGSPVKI